MPLAAFLRLKPAAELLGSPPRQFLTSSRRDHGVGPNSTLTSLQTLPERGRVRVRGQQDVAGGRPEKGEALLEVLDRHWVLAAAGEAETLCGDRRHAVGINETQAALAFARLPRPT